MKKSILVITFLVWGILSSGCNNPKEANKENFIKVINKYLLENKNGLACTKIGKKFPFEDEYGFNEKKLDNLVSLGVLKLIKKEEEKKDYLSGKKVIRTKKFYDLTKRGRENLSNGKICLGEPTVKKIVNFTEPVVFMDKKITEVRYSYTLEKLPDWYTTNNKLSEKKLLLYLTNNGWEYK